MEAVFKSKNKNIYDSADMALYDDAMHADFLMFTQTGEACNDIALCKSVWCPTPESVVQFEELRQSANRFLNVCLYGSVSEGFNYYDECEGNWILVGTSSAMAEMSATIFNHIARLEKEGKW